MRSRLLLLLPVLFCALTLRAQQPLPEPVDITPINGETYYILNQFDGRQMDLSAGSISNGSTVVEESASFTSLSQRWSVTKLADGAWKISNLLSGLCLDTSLSSAVQNTCAINTASQEWSLNSTTNGYYNILNQATGQVLGIQGTPAAGAQLNVSSAAGSQTQQWLLRPVFFRGIDNALLEKQEAARAAQTNLAWWNDAGTATDVLKLFKNHGVNMVRLRPSSGPPNGGTPTALLPYADPSFTGCVGASLCYAETDALDLDLARRAKNLGMSIELTLLFDGQGSSSVPAAWAADASNITNLKADIYNYVKKEIENYRAAGVMPDLVSIGNEVDTGFLSPSGTGNSPNGNTPATFANFAALQTSAVQAVKDAASDTSIGAAIPAPLTCIHITPAWDLTNFFTLASQSGITVDAICQSYYPLFHGPLTAAQAATSNPGGKPVEQTVLNNAANSIAKPIFIIEAGEHYENGFDSNDPWYPPSLANQRQYLVDLDSVLRAVPNNLAMGMEYWDPEGVDLSNPTPPPSLLNGTNQPNAIYSWTGLTIFDNSSVALLPAADALGGKFDPSLRYKLVNRATGNILESQGGSSASGASLDTATDTGVANLYQQWLIASDGDGFFRITNANSSTVLDDSAASKSAGSAVVQATATGSTEQEWNVVTAGGGYCNVVNNLSGLVLDISGGLAVQNTLSGAVGSTTQQWQIVPVHITTAGAAGFVMAADPPSISIAQGASGTAVITLTPSGGYSGSATFSCAGLPTSATCAFSNSPVTFDGKDTVQTTTLTISTQGAAAAPPLLRFSWRDWRPGPSALSLAGLILLVVWLFFVSRDQSLLVLRRQFASRLRLSLAVLAAACVLALAGCGGGGGGSGSSGGGGGGGSQPPVTPLGTTVVTVTASVGNSSQNIGILVNVVQ
ncbi:MAG: glycosyl hydrolase 53 family protein [Candidatus Acidiferrales bacterium]|jgi:arabinogalactan endo-1,4-beta-galactosidase